MKGTESGVLYESWSEDLLFVYAHAGEWIVEWNGEPLPFRFRSFEEAERHMKRQYGAWLSRDDVFVKMLKEQWRRNRSNDRPGLPPDMDEEKLMEDL